MKIGLMSDTHGDVGRSYRAGRELLHRGVQAVCHCGDIGSERVLAELAALFGPPAIPVHAVLGNVDLYEADVEGFPRDSGVQVWGRIAKLTLHGRRLAVVHGDDAAALQKAIASQRYDYVFTGHTHVAADERRDRTRVINPGAVAHAHPPSVAVLDLASGALELIALAPH